MVNRKSDTKGFKYSRSLGILLLITLFLTGCVSLTNPETTQDYNKKTVARVRPGQTVGQTFVSKRPRLNGIYLWLKTDHAGQLFTIELFQNIGDQIPVFSGNFSASDGKNRIEFQPQDDPSNQTYYLRLSGNTGEVSLLGRDEDNYPLGTATINDQPIGADLAFRATYKYDVHSAFEDFKELFLYFYLILPLCSILFLPGWLLLDLANLTDQFEWGERVGISLGLSLAIIPLLMLWTSVVGLRWGPISVWLVSGFLILTWIWRLYKDFSSNRDQGLRKHKKSIGVNNGPQSDLLILDDDHQSTYKKSLSPIHYLKSLNITHHLEFFILLSIFAITLLTRFAMVRDLAAPPWVDSIHHGLITRLMLETGGLPETYAPFLPSEANHYHFGFHSALSTFIWFTGFEIHEGMLIFGQVLNALIVFSVYLLTITLTQNRPAALSASLIAGVFTLMPAYYTSWGRYTQLAGLLILPVGLRIFANLSKEERIPTFKQITLWILGAVTLAGLFLVHYRVAAFLGLLIFAYLVAQIKPKRWLINIYKLVVIGMFSVILLLPWLPGLINNLLLPKGSIWTGGDASFSQVPLNFLKPAMGETSMVLAGIGLLLGLILLKRFTVTILLWTGLIYLLANLRVFGLPGSGFVNPVSMEITLFMPISIFGGFAIGGTLELLDKFIPDRWQFVPRIIFVILGIGAAILGAQRLIPTLNPITFLAREADFPSIDWIDKNLPEDETILINPTGWGYGLYMGHDGGYWISPLTGRQTMPPSVLYGLGNRTEVERINKIMERVLPIGEDATALWELLRSENIRFVYTGRRGGIISPQTLEQSNLFSVRYQQEGTWVFETLENIP